MDARSLRDVLPFAPALVALLLFAGAHLRYARTQRAEANFYNFTQQLGRGEFDAARRSVGAAVGLGPGDAHYLSDAALLEERSLRRGFDFERFRQPTLNTEEAARVAAAAALYRRVLELNPLDDHASHNLGWLHWLAGEREEALARLRRAAELEPDLPLYHVSLGLLHEYVADSEASHGAYARALGLSPSLIDSDFFRELRARRPDEAERLTSEAVEHFEAQVGRGAGVTVKAKLGKLYLERDPERGAALLREATAELPNLSRPWLSLGEWYARAGDRAQAARCYRRAVFLDGRDATALLRLAEHYERERKSPEAIAFYRRAVNSWVTQPTAHAGRVRRLYVSRFAVNDDVIPSGLSRYASPAFDLRAACARLSALYREAGDEASAARYEQLARDHAP